MLKNQGGPQSEEVVQNGAESHEYVLEGYNDATEGEEASSDVSEMDDE